MKLTDISNLSKEDVLGALGLQPKETMQSRLLGSLAMVGVGAAVGAAVALMLAPSSGEELRDNLTRRARRMMPKNGLSRETVARSAAATHEPASVTHSPLGSHSGSGSGSGSHS